MQLKYIKKIKTFLKICNIESKMNKNEKFPKLLKKFLMKL